ncbi:hypothetical protein GONAM_57_00150, partial [Gordonia namibiensis NBRC 108229]
PPPAPPVRTSAPTDAPARDAGARSPLGRRPSLDDAGRRPLAASVSPENSTPTTRGRRTSGPSPMERGLSPDATPAATPRPGTGPVGPRSADADSGRRRPRSDRHARSDETGDDAQISVQELLKRSRSEK